MKIVYGKKGYIWVSSWVATMLLGTQTYLKHDVLAVRAMTFEEANENIDQVINKENLKSLFPEGLEGVIDDSKFEIMKTDPKRLEEETILKVLDLEE